MAGKGWPKACQEDKIQNAQKALRMLRKQSPKEIGQMYLKKKNKERYLFTYISKITNFWYLSFTGLFYDKYLGKP